MRTAAALVSLLLLAAPAGAQEEAPDPRVRELLLLDGAPFVELELGGAKGWFLLDTGANVSGVDRGWLKETGARHELEGSSRLGGTTGSVAVGRARFEELLLGTARFTRSVWLVHDYSGFRAPPEAKRQSGLLGTDFLRSLQVEVDYAARRARFSKKDERPPRSTELTPTALSWINGHPTVSVRLAGIDIPCRLDSGASYLREGPLLDVNAHVVTALRAAGVELREAGTITVRGVAGPRTLGLLQGGLTLELGALRLEDVTLVVHEQGSLSVDGPLGLASASVLGKAGRWVLDPFDHLFWVGRGPRADRF